MENFKILKEIEQKVLWLSCWMIHNANHIRENFDGIKVGGHQASCASMVSMMVSLYFGVLKPEDRVAVKPHASPVFHAIQYLAGLQKLEKIQNFRGFNGAQSYPSRTKDMDDVDISTGSVGLGVAMTSFLSLTQDYIRKKKFNKYQNKGKMIALVGDAELDEGNIYECLQEGWKHDLRNVWWIIDYNRQSLDGVVHEGLWEKIDSVFKSFGWNVVVIKYGELQLNAFNEPGGEKLKEWIDNCPNQLYSALIFEGGIAIKERILDDIGDQGNISKLLDSRTDDEFLELMTNLGGHCIKSLKNAFDTIKDDKPTAFLAYTIKGWGTPLAGHKDNHAGLMTKSQMNDFKSKMKINEGEEWNDFSKDNKEIHNFIINNSFQKAGFRRFKSEKVSVDKLKPLNETKSSTQNAFGKLLDLYSRLNSEFSNRILTTSPDVSVSTNLGPWVNRVGLFSREESQDTFKKRQIPSVQKWEFSPEGQHVELGIAEMNLFLMLSSAGLSHEFFGERLFPIGTVYDPFISRGLDALNYACYQNARFLLVATPSGITLAPEGGAHQSVGTPLIGIGQPGLISYEPAFVDELEVILDHSFNYLQDEKNGGSVYLRLSTKSLDQPNRNLSHEEIENVVKGGYWLREPGRSPKFIIAYQGVVAEEVIRASIVLGEKERDFGILSITSSDLLFSDWKKSYDNKNNSNHLSHIENLFKGLPSDCNIITLIDGHPLTLSWLSGVNGNPLKSLGVDEFGQTGNSFELYEHFGIDSRTLVETAIK